MSELKIYLASQSPRRRQLLDQIEVGYKIIDSDVDEKYQVDESATQYVARLALDKARQGWLNSKQTDLPVLGADTCIVQGDSVMGKPRDEAHALQMLEDLSGRQHDVLTAIALVGKPMQNSGNGPYTEKVKISCSKVSFRAITKQERQWYWNTGEPAGKAGAYAIQGLGAIFISKIEGSYSGIMGLPLFEVSELLSEFGIDLM